MSFLLRSDNWPVGWLLYSLAAAACLYALGGRRTVKTNRVRSAAFYGGIATLALAVASPIDAYSDRLFWVHMIQHVLLTMVAPPLLLLGRPWPRMLKPFAPSVRRPVARAVLVGSTLGPLRAFGRWLSAPLPAFVLFTVVLLGWHVPALYDLTLRNAFVHDVEHMLFFGSALLFWLHLVPGAAARSQLSYGQRTAYGTGGLLVSWGLAVVLALASSPFYSAYSSLGSRPGGLSALADQQLAAGIMWVPASVPFTIAIFVSAYRWLDPSSGRRRGAVTVRDLRPRET
ncbi:MAG TPA: cytochrome c oxidase assembly protein [Gaiellaceae bacterium]|nr:cytochrome c oxidase assembly protein [Gaiellaceae bacterium]